MRPTRFSTMLFKYRDNVPLKLSSQTTASALPRATLPTPPILEAWNFDRVAQLPAADRCPQCLRVFNHSATSH